MGNLFCNSCLYFNDKSKKRVEREHIYINALYPKSFRIDCQIHQSVYFATTALLVLTWFNSNTYFIIMSVNNAYCINNEQCLKYLIFVCNNNVSSFFHFKDIIFIFVTAVWRVPYKLNIKTCTVITYKPKNIIQTDPIGLTGLNVGYSLYGLQLMLLMIVMILHFPGYMNIFIID